MAIMTDWTDCPDVECKPNVLSGVAVVRGSRVQADAIVANAADGYTAEEIAEQIFDLPVSRVRGILSFARTHGFHPA